jgi:hypothetical protein
LASSTTSKDTDEQYRIHLTYVQAVGIIEEDFRQYLVSRKNNPSTRAISRASSSSSSVVQPLGGRTQGTVAPQPTNQDRQPDQRTVPGRLTSCAPSPAPSSHSSRRTRPSQRAQPAALGASSSTSRKRKEAEQALRQLKTVEVATPDDEEQRKQNVKD